MVTVNSLFLIQFIVCGIMLSVYTFSKFVFTTSSLLSCILSVSMKYRMLYSWIIMCQGYKEAVSLDSLSIRNYYLLSSMTIVLRGKRSRSTNKYRYSHLPRSSWNIKHCQFTLTVTWKSRTQIIWFSFCSINTNTMYQICVYRKWNGSVNMMYIRQTYHDYIIQIR